MEKITFNTSDEFFTLYEIWNTFRHNENMTTNQSSQEVQQFESCSNIVKEEFNISNSLAETHDLVETGINLVSENIHENIDISSNICVQNDEFESFILDLPVITTN